MRVWLGRLLLLIVGTVSGILLAEVLLRLLAPAGGAWMVANSPSLYDTRIFYVDDERRLSLRPGAEGTFQTPEFRTTVRINEHGLRGGPVSSGTAKRVLAVGDSFTLGVQVSEPDTFQARLGAALTEALGEPVEVLNGGVDSHGTYDALKQVERVADAVELDAVVLTFFTGNDLWDDWPLVVELFEKSLSVSDIAIVVDVRPFVPIGQIPLGIDGNDQNVITNLEMLHGASVLRKKHFFAIEFFLNIVLLAFETD